MNSQLIKWELKKQHHSHLPLILFCFIIVAVFLGSFLYFMNQQVFSEYQTQWLALWGEIGLFYAQLFFPLLIAIIVNTICHQELDRNSWYLPSLLPIRGDKLLFAKVTITSFYSLLSQALLIILYYLIASLAQFPLAHVNPFTFIWWAVSGWIGSISIIALQFWISINFSRFTSLVFALILGLGNFVALLMGTKIFYLYPYSQIAVGMRVRSYENMSLSEFIFFLIINLVWMIIGVSLSIITIKRKYHFL
ncbi:ABC transporter permease [Streptococcus gallolyticus]|uniref:ABC-2 family transporter protein n=1 Tax=Streptococcus gallolyticus TaxID=315405 RepID=A0A1H9SRZ7_9STRE|nr:ABC transporter permease [Streptococcus gallolyticus]SER87691.1 ABC-2 family transporter protein [Streptococcus gallolyticus]